jgi:hypothetical protein
MREGMSEIARATELYPEVIVLAVGAGTLKPVGCFNFFENRSNFLRRVYAKSSIGIQEPQPRKIPFQNNCFRWEANRTSNSKHFWCASISARPFREPTR